MTLPGRAGSRVANSQHRAAPALPIRASARGAGGAAKLPAMDVVTLDAIACLMSVREAAETLHVDRKTVRSRMAREDIAPIQLGGLLFVRRDDLPKLGPQPRVPPPRRPRPQRGLPPMALATLRLLADWEEATAEELAVGLERHPGNVRKYLAILRHQGLAATSPDRALPAAPSWLLTDTGRELLAASPHTEAAA